jgi:hypothetical protein
MLQGARGHTIAELNPILCGGGRCLKLSETRQELEENDGRFIGATCATFCGANVLIRMARS